MTTKEDKTLARIIREALTAGLYDVHVCLPARIETYDPTAQKADVKPLLKKKYKTGDEVELPVVTAVPVQWPSANGGEAFLHLPLAAGDTGLLIFCERSLDAWLQGDGQIVAPADPRHHHLSDGIFVPGLKPFGSPLAAVSGSNAVLQNGQMRVELDPSGKISIQGASQEFLTVVESVLDHLLNARVITCLGASPFIGSTLLNFQTDKANLATIKRA